MKTNKGLRAQTKKTIISARIIAFIFCLSLVFNVFVGCDDRIQYLISFETFGGASIAPQRYYEGDRLDLPSASWTHYNFEGWFLDEKATHRFTNTTMPAQNIKLYASFSALKSFIISFETNGGSKVDNIIVEQGGIASSPTIPELYGRDFQGWYTDEDLTNKYEFGSALTSDIKLYAKWTISPLIVPISFYANNRLVKTVEISRGETITADSILDENEYIFDAWTDSDGNEFDFDSAVTDVDKLDLFTSYYSKDLSFSGNTVTAYTGTTANAVVVVPQNVTEIAQNAFANKTNISSIYLDGNVTTIGKSAFSGCTSLTNIYGTDKIEVLEESAFYNCTSLISIDLQNVEAVSDNAFNKCSSLQNVTLGESLTAIKTKAFTDCSSLKNITLGDNVTSIESFAFQNCTSLVSFELPAALIEFGVSVFDGCTSLQSLTVASGNTSFSQSGGSIYSDGGTTLVHYSEILNAGSTSFEIPEGVTKIEKSAFVNNTNIQSLSLPSTLTRDGSLGVLNGLTALKSLTLSFDEIPYLAHLYGAQSETENGSNSSRVPANLKTVVLEGDNIPDYAFYGCKNLTSLLGVENAKTIGAYAFAFTTFMSEFTVSSALESVGDGAFYSSSVLTFANSGNTKFKTSASPAYLYSNTDNTLIRMISSERVDVSTISSDVERIADYAFENSTMTDVTIPASVTHIGRAIFFNCTKLKNLTTPLPSLSDTQDFNYLFGASDYSLNSLTVVGNLTTISKLAFSGTKINTIALTDTVTKIDNNAFIDSTVSAISGVQNVTQVGNYAFYNCVNLGSIALDNVVSIGQWAFRDSGLTGFTIPNSLETIGSYAFTSGNSASRFQRLDFEGSVSQSKLKIIDDNAFSGNKITGDLVLPATLTNIKSYAFSGSQISSISFEGTKSESLEVGNNAFDRCNSLLSADFSGSNMTYLGGNAFYLSEKIETVILPETLKTIGSFAFIYCTNLENIVLPSSLTSVGQRILDFTKWFDNYGGDNYNGIMYNGVVAVGYKGLIAEGSTITFADNVDGTDIRVICERFFYSGQFQFDNVAEVIIPSTYKYISDYAFSMGNNLKKVTIGSSDGQSELAVIGSMAFFNCLALDELILYKDIASANDAPHLVEYVLDIYSGTFVFGKNLVLTENGLEFEKTNLVIYVPAQSLDFYTEAWGEYANFASIESR